MMIGAPIAEGSSQNVSAAGVYRFKTHRTVSDLGFIRSATRLGSTR
jgi:hypothetical protein